jgi:hypothetical protein
MEQHCKWMVHGAVLGIAPTPERPRAARLLRVTNHDFKLKFNLPVKLTVTVQGRSGSDASLVPVAPNEGERRLPFWVDLIFKLKSAFVYTFQKKLKRDLFWKQF